MIKFPNKKGLIFVYILVLGLFVSSAYFFSRTATVLSENMPFDNRNCVIIDAGHGGVDGGATSCTGVLESQFNLEIALKLNDLLHLLGIDTQMIRTTDCSVYTQGSTIAQKKVSDLKERVRIVNSKSNAILVSIHQNTFQSSRYSGAQVFYAPTEGSRELAQALQSAAIQTINPTSSRKIKKANGIYLMQNIRCTGVLVECGFLSNPEEENLLRNGDYQRKLCAVIASTLSTHLFSA